MIDSLDSNKDYEDKDSEQKSSTIKNCPNHQEAPRKSDEISEQKHSNEQQSSRLLFRKDWEEGAISARNFPN